MIHIALDLIFKEYFIVCIHGACTYVFILFILYFYIYAGFISPAINLITNVKATVYNP